MEMRSSRVGIWPGIASLSRCTHLPKKLVMCHCTSEKACSDATSSAGVMCSRSPLGSTSSTTSANPAIHRRMCNLCLNRVIADTVYGIGKVALAYHAYAFTNSNVPVPNRVMPTLQYPLSRRGLIGVGKTEPQL